MCACASFREVGEAIHRLTTIDLDFEASAKHSTLVSSIPHYFREK
jgi:hypothetical protein